VALKEPSELLRIFHAALERLGNKSDLTLSEQRRLANELSDVYNYVSETARKPSLQNTLRTQSAQQAKQQEQLKQEREVLQSHKDFVTENFDKAEHHLRAIQVGGYAAFFGLWSVTMDWIDPVWSALAALLMLISATVFVLWEVARATILSFCLKRHSVMGRLPLEEFLRKRSSFLTDEKAAVLKLAESRSTVWLISVLPAAAAIIIMMLQLATVLGEKIL